MLLREPSASPSGRLVAGCMMAATMQMTVALFLATAVPDAVTSPPAPLAVQIAMLPPSPPGASATPVEATLRDVAPPDPTPLESLPQAPAVPDTATAPSEPPPIQGLLASPPAVGPDAPRAPPAELPAAPAAPHTKPRSARLADPVRPPIRAVLHRTRLQPTPQAGTMAPRAPAGDALPAQPASAAAPLAVPPAAPSRAGLDSYEGRLKSAIQAALRYPPAAAMMGRDGRARVAFSISDARAADIRLPHGTGSSQLDEAALAAVRQAAYPRPPAEIGTRSLAMLVWVEFSRPDAEE